ncbi:hypothetical protein CDCA_CDCA09G2695 [Cyanidium caldarium]|uniref:TRIP4/RQT4 C2HC5-type zinc finger domain-containing protein n=1 Tax=Cyanidium caldarium TaxID=2771 RepID=A0AAV9IX51_CYACA|nr:hypothetical protein CDCA_CDCA09G2695 [Cyanidium caldarium]|eukprot:ctg_390.g206
MESGREPDNVREEIHVETNEGASSSATSGDAVERLVSYLWGGEREHSASKVHGPHRRRESEAASRDTTPGANAQSERYSNSMVEEQYTNRSDAHPPSLRCDCWGVEHGAWSNCLCCGRVVCNAERSTGSDAAACPFCGTRWDASAAEAAARAVTLYTPSS